MTDAEKPPLKMVGEPDAAVCLDGTCLLPTSAASGVEPTVASAVEPKAP